MLSSRLFCSLSSDRFVFWQQWQHKLPSKFICNAILSHCCCTANWTGKFFSISSLSALYLIGEIPMVLLVQTHKHTSRVGITTGRQLLRSYPGQVLTCKNWLLPCILVILQLQLQLLRFTGSCTVTAQEFKGIRAVCLYAIGLPGATSQPSYLPATLSCLQSEPSPAQAEQLERFFREKSGSKSPERSTGRQRAPEPACDLRKEVC